MRKTGWIVAVAPAFLLPAFATVFAIESPRSSIEAGRNIGNVNIIIP